MLIVCPSCTSRYNIDDAKIGVDGRKVRCAACGTQWHVSRSDAAPQAEPPLAEPRQDVAMQAPQWPEPPPPSPPAATPDPVFTPIPQPEPEADPFDEEAMAREWARAEAFVDETSETGGLTADRIRAVDAGDSLPDVAPSGAERDDQPAMSKAAGAAALGLAAAAARVPWWRRLLARLFARKPKASSTPKGSSTPGSQTAPAPNGPSGPATDVVPNPAPPIASMQPREAAEPTAAPYAAPEPAAAGDALAASAMAAGGANASGPIADPAFAGTATEPAAKRPAPARTPPRKGKVAKARRPARLPTMPMGPIAAGIAGFAMLGGLYWQREALVRLVPSAAPVFQAAGVPVNLTGLSFSDIRSTIHREADGRFLVVEGVIRSEAREQVPVPQIELGIRGEDGRTVYTWTAEPPRRSLRPGESLHFRTRLATPPEAARNVEVRFSNTGQSASARP
jgi:predicted Zn finger-like uncharacterized protein